MSADAPVPSEIRLDRSGRLLTVRYGEGVAFELTSEYLRVHSPSAEVKGHGGGEGILQLDKQDVTITGVEPVGNYAVRLQFSDGHATGLYTWALLHALGTEREERWRRYLERVATAKGQGS
jgi:DUF971 family protein